MNQYPKWTRAQTDMLRSEYPKRSTADVALFVGRTAVSVRHKARQMGIRKAIPRGIRWDPWMIALLKQHFPDTKTALLAEWLGVSKNAVAAKAAKLGLTKRGRLRKTVRRTVEGKRRVITEQDGAFIREHAGTMTLKEIGEHLGVGANAVSAYCSRNGISRFWKREGTYNNIVLTPYGVKYLKKYFRNTRNDVLMANMGLSHSTLHRFARQYGLKKTGRFMQACQAATTEAARKANQERGWPPKGYRIPGKEKAGFKKGVTPLMRLGPKRNAERIRKARDSRERTRQLEKARVAAGEPQQTKLRITILPREVVSQRWYLRKRGYIIDTRTNTAYWTPETRRAPLLESRQAEGQGYWRFAEYAG